MHHCFTLEAINLRIKHFFTYVEAFKYEYVELQEDLTIFSAGFLRLSTLKTLSLSHNKHVGVTFSKPGYLLEDKSMCTVCFY